MSIVRRQLKRSFRETAKALGERKKISEWLTDNFYLIDREYDRAMKNRDALKQSRSYELLVKLVAEKGEALDEDALIKAASEVSPRLGYSELAAFGALLPAVLIIRIGAVLRESNGEGLPSLIRLLISSGRLDLERVVSSVWEPEETLARYESGYKSFDKGTKDMYRRRVALLAKKHGVSENEEAVRLVQRALVSGRPLGDILLAHSRMIPCAWLLMAFGLFLMLLGAGAEMKWLLIPLVFPLFSAAFAAADLLCSLLIPATCAPRMELSEVPEDAKTLVTVVSLLSGTEDIDRAFRSLERFFYMNPDDNIYFCLLADFPDSAEQYLITDANTVIAAKERIDELNSRHGDRFCLFFRDRTLLESEGRYGGRERKRGAVCDLVSFIAGRSGNDYYGGDFIHGIKYILTLDSDTNLSVGSVRELVSVALHPVNIPRVENGKVISGYGIFQPSIKTTLKSAYKTRFSRLISGSGGTDVYEFASFDREMSVFGSGVFCGKGLIDVPLFDRLVCGRIPDSLVLSHDVIEGSILGTCLVSDISLTDSTPGNAVSFFRRLHRWCRGDFQNLFFLGGDLLAKNAKLRLLLISAKHAVPLFAVISLLLGAFLPELARSGALLILLAFSYLLLPFVISLSVSLFSFRTGAILRFFSRAYSEIFQSFSRLFYEMTSVCRRAFLVLDAYRLAAYRMITRRKTLEWTASAQVELLSSGLGKYVLDGLFPSLTGLTLLFFAPPPFIRLVGILWFVYPMISLFLSRELGSGGAAAKPSLTKKQCAFLTSSARDMWGFYADNVSEKTCFLPPDNIQLSPVEYSAPLTSPTNIGFYLVSVLAARDFEFIDTATLCDLLEKTLATVGKLEKWKGNLYNWYDISDLSVLGDRFVSSVDSGNFVVMLTALAEGLADYETEDRRIGRLIGRCRAVCAETSLVSFYDGVRNLFSIGYSEKEGRLEGNCYDLLMSEARMTGYYAVASSAVPKKHWQSLGRTLTRADGHMGMLSWSGTAFEYLLPQLFLPLFRDSFMYESIEFALMLQRKDSPVWGRSESGYYAFDSEMHYQYRANGIRGLALRKVSERENVISPYSTYLSLCALGSSAIKNLVLLSRLGMYGRYGLYEAIDFSHPNSPDGIRVRSYMAHHIGMSIVSCANAVFDRAFIRRFMSDDRMGSASELLQEKIPTDAHIFETERSRVRHAYRAGMKLGNAVRSENPIFDRVSLLSGNGISATVSDYGHVGLRAGDTMISNTVFDRASLRFTPLVLFSEGESSYGCSMLYGSGSYSVERGSSYVSHINATKEFSGRVRYSLSRVSDCFIIGTRADSRKKYDLTLAFEPVMQRAKDFYSHIGFSRLFVESEYDKRENILYFHRRSRVDGSHIFSVAVALRDTKQSFSFLTSKNSYPASSLNSPRDILSVPPDNKCGASLDPLCLIRVSASEGGRAVFLISCGKTKADCRDAIKACRSDPRETESVFGHTTDEILSRVLFEKRGIIADKLPDISIGELWSKGISGDHPIVTAFLSAPRDASVKALLTSFRDLTSAGIRLEVVFVVSGDEKYNRPVERSISELCASTDTSAFLNKNGGIFILRAETLSESFICSLRQASAICTSLDSGLFSDCGETVGSVLRDIVCEPRNAFPKEMPENAYQSGNGYFTGSGYVTDKSRLPGMPYSYILAGKRFASVVTQSSLGYTFFDNARERRLCSFFGDPRTLDDGERLILFFEDRAYDLCACSDTVEYSSGRAHYSGSIEHCAFSVTVFVCPEFPVKLMRVCLTDPLLKCGFMFRPTMGDSVFPSSRIVKKPFFVNGNAGVMFSDPLSMSFPEGHGFCGVCGGSSDIDCETLYGKGNDILFFIGACMTEGGAENICSRISSSFFDAQSKRAFDFAASMLPDFVFSTRSRA